MPAAATGYRIVREGAILLSVQPMKLSILMSAHDEGQATVQAVQELLQVIYPCDIELIVVVNGSTDSASKFLAQIGDPRVIVHRRSSSLGKEASLIFSLSSFWVTHLAIQF